MQIHNKILGVEGSPRKQGNSHNILQAILNGAQNNQVPTKDIHLRDYKFDPCMGCEKCRKDKICTHLNDGMTLLYPDIIASKGLVLVSPVHNYNVSAWMKAFIDRMYCFYEFQNTRPRSWKSDFSGQGRKAVIAAVAEQESLKDMGFTLDAMRMSLEALEYEVIDEIPVLNIFDRGKVKEYPEIIERLTKSGEKLASELSK